MAAVKRGYTSRTTNALNEQRKMGKSSNCTVVPIRNLTVSPCAETTLCRLANNRKKAPHATTAGALNRSRSGVIGFDRNNFPPWSLYQREQRNTSSSASNSGVFTAPRGLVTYLQLCRPIVPQVRTRYRTHNSNVHETKMGVEITCPKGDSALMVYGVPFGHAVPCKKNLHQSSEKVHIHVYLPCEQQSGQEGTRSPSEEEEACSKLSNLSLREDKDLEMF